MRDKCKAISLGFHDVVEEACLVRPVLPGHTTLYTLERREFRKHLEAIRSRIDSGVLHRVDLLATSARKHLFLTFDDGASSAYKCVAPELEALGWVGHFFITTDWIGRPGFMDRSQIRELYERGHVIGSHSCSHPTQMPRLGWERLVHEWSESCRILSDIVGARVSAASVPEGDFSLSVGRAAAASGIKFLFTSEPTTTVCSLAECLVLGRYAIRRSTPVSTSGAIAAGEYWPQLKLQAQWFATKNARRLMGPCYVPVRRLLMG